MTALQCTNCRAPLSAAATECPFCGADVTEPGARMRTSAVPGILAPSLPFESAASGDSGEPGSSEVYESVPELDDFVPFDGESDRRGAPRSHHMGLRLLAVIAGAAMVASALGATAWLAWRAVTGG